MTGKIRIGIDLGGTKIAAIAFGQHDEVLFEDRKPTPHNDYDETLQVIAQLVASAKLVAGLPASIGIGIPGSVSRQSGLIQNANSTWLNGKEFAKDLEIKLGQPVQLANDANCLALSESHDGAGKDYQCIFAVIIGTGCGAGLVVDKKLHTGRHGIGGEWGHTPLPLASSDETPGPECWCGRHGCIETWVSGSGLERDFHLTNDIIVSAQEIEKMAQSGDKAANNALDNHCDRLARSLAMVSNIIDPDVIILGGGLSNMKHLYADLDEKMRPHIFADHFSPNIKPAQHGDASGVRGAARLWD